MTDSIGEYAGSGSRVPVPGPLIIGHRGFAARHPDNSLAGVRAALAVGADGVEVDVRLCAEGVWVCHHDRSRARRALESWPLAKLERAGVPTLEQVVAAMPASAWLYVEVKPLGRAELERHLESLLAPLVPRLATTRLLSSSEMVLGVVEMARPALARSLVFGELPEWMPNEAELSPRHQLVDELLWTGRRLHPWTVNRAARMRELATLGVASITSNRPDLAVKVLRARA
jgi:glycerophosphoryl diester phosphodiesterase